MKFRFLVERLPLKERFRRFGRTYFSKNAERTLFFILTVAMLVMGLLYKANLL